MSRTSAGGGPPRGSIVHGYRGAVAAGSADAAHTAVDVLTAGGTAMDAAVAASAVQCVVEFPWCGVGGDMFMLVDRADTGVVALNGSGAAPADIGTGLRESPRVPRFGPLSVAVPGLPMAWQVGLARFGSRPLTDLLEPATKLAYDGFRVDERLSRALAQVHPELADHPELAALVNRNGSTVGALFSQPDLGRTLEALGRHGAEWFYRGEFAERLAAHMRAHGGPLGPADLARHEADWTEPLSIDYRGHQIYQTPPVSLGVLMLSQLRILEQFDLARLRPGSAELIDLMVRAKLAAFADLPTTVPDPDQPGWDVREQLSAERVAWWRDRLSRLPYAETVPAPGGTDTTCLAVTDATGMTVTMIHSLFNSFGSRELVDGTGVILNDRLAGLRTGAEPGPRLVPGARPSHTLNAYLVKRGGRVVIAGATPGGRGQVQTNTQILVNLVDHGMSPLAAVEHPRWLHGTPRRYAEDSVLHVEDGLPDGSVDRLGELGYEVRVADGSDDDDLFGSATVVGPTPCTGLYAVADGRRGAAATAW
ncbi:gamma-glutamyltransferase [Plantactinospora mayteni]|uniref:Gamma-glutamyltransferase n=1 Tax=Plantactinospora mayteni TaxID=566021 RepID=A0ABQ4ER86_9ACTN|nr:gamma-glutamyltransferase [Plantactinospora mayteni]GIG97187.1 gamma-glutamyltransferase [Plantactinospora mayteni]